MIAQLAPPAIAQVTVAMTAWSSLKVVIAGGYAAGKTTFVRTVSDPDPVTSDMTITSWHGIAVAPRTRKATTTVALDVGRVVLGNALAVYLFGTPSLRRFAHMWQPARSGAAGAVVVVDARRLPECFAAVDAGEQQCLPFVIVANQFDDSPRYTGADLREALAIPDDVPVLSCDVRDRASATATLLALIERVRAVARSGPNHRPASPMPSLPQPLWRTAS